MAFLVFGQVACGGGSTVYLGGYGGHDGTDAGQDSNDTNSETSGVFGATTVTSTSEHYEVIVSIGDAAPLGIIESDSGVYEIQTPLTF